MIERKNEREKAIHTEGILKGILIGLMIVLILFIII